MVNFKDGLVDFNNPSRQEIITLSDSERKILTLFRKMPAGFQKDCLSRLDEIAELGKVPYKLSHSEETGQRTKKKKQEGSEKAAQVLVRQPKQRRKPGRKKLDKKALQEKIDKLKMLTRSINKITVR